MIAIACGSTSRAEELVARVLPRAFSNLYADNMLHIARLTTSPRFGKGRSITVQVIRSVDSGSRFLLLRVLSPADARGTSLLVRSSVDRHSADVLLYLPAIRSMRRLSPGQAQDLLFGTDLSVVDIDGSIVQEYRVTDSRDDTEDNCTVFEAELDQWTWQYKRLVGCVSRQSQNFKWLRFLDLSGQTKSVELIDDVRLVSGCKALKRRLLVRNSSRKSITTVDSIVMVRISGFSRGFFSTNSLEGRDAEDDRLLLKRHNASARDSISAVSARIEAFRDCTN